MISGTLHYISDYSSAFGGDLAHGNYIALHFEHEDADEIEVTLTNTVTLDEDGNIVLRIADKDTQTITVVAYVDNEAVDTKEYALTGLTLEEPEDTTGIVGEATVGTSTAG